MSQYEAKLRFWGIRKNLKREEWQDLSNFDPQNLRDVEDLRRLKEALASKQNSEQKHANQSQPVAPFKGILHAPREKFPKNTMPLREEVAQLKDAKKDGIPPGARWTKISRKLVNPEALEAGKERFEAREDFVIVLRVLSADEVQGYAEVTQRIRGKQYHKTNHLKVTELTILQQHAKK
jgi:hypothetical protein